MRKRLVGLLASTMIVFAACSGGGTPAPTETSGASAPPASTSTGPSASPISAIDQALFASTFQPTTGAQTGRSSLKGFSSRLLKNALSE